MSPNEATPTSNSIQAGRGRLKSTLGGVRERKNEIEIELENKAFKDEG